MSAAGRLRRRLARSSGLVERWLGLPHLRQRVDEAVEGLADRAPVSEVARLDRAFVELAQRAPASEVERLDLAYEGLAQRAPISEVERLNQAFEELTRLRVGLDMLLSERSVEVPWVLSSYGGERRVLEVGAANAEVRYLKALATLSVPHLVGLDLASALPHVAGLFAEHVVGDVRDADVFPPGSFDLVLCISTIEHVGRDNRVYGLSDERGVGRPDHEAARAIASWLAPGGRLLLSVPFGRWEDHGWLVNYDAERLDALVAASGLELDRARYYEQRGGWVPCDREELRRRGYRSLEVPHAGGVALLELRRQGG